MYVYSDHNVSRKYSEKTRLLISVNKAYLVILSHYHTGKNAVIPNISTAVFWLGVIRVMPIFSITTQP